MSVCYVEKQTVKNHGIYSSWGKLERTYLIHHFGSAPSESSIICKKHLLEAKRHYHSLHHTPSWKKQIQKSLHSSKKCNNPKCTQQNEKLIKPTFAPVDQVCKILGVETTTHQEFVLCQKCYNVTYQTFFEYRKPCSSCGAIPKTSKIFNRTVLMLKL